MTAGREALLECLRSALAAVGGRRVVARFLRKRGLAAPVYLVAIGKAAADMASGALDTNAVAIAAGLVITKQGHLEALHSPPAGFELIESAHPVPDGRSLAAGRRLLGFLRAAPPDARFLFLVSGGASSLVEQLPQGLDGDFLARMNAWLLGSGLPIAAVNRVRRACSGIKGGRLIPYLEGRPALNLLISDVPGDDPAVIGSGLLVPAPAGPLPEMPDWLTQALAHNGAPIPEAPAGTSVETHIVASPQAAVRAAAGRARELGYRVSVAEAFLDGDAHEAGRACAREVLDGSPGIRLWSAETTVRLPAEPGRGGRNQAVALAAATVLEGHGHAWLLAAGTDGTDGPTEDAGALVDGGSIARGREQGLDPAVALARADSGRFLAASGDLVYTGPTGTNVMDLVIGLKLGDRR